MNILLETMEPDSGVVDALSSDKTLHGSIGKTRNRLGKDWRTPLNIRSFLRLGGFRIAGTGQHSTVWEKPGSDWVIKVSSKRGSCWSKFVDYVESKNDPHLPKILKSIKYGKADDPMTVVFMEKLEPIREQEWLKDPKLIALKDFIKYYGLAGHDIKNVFVRKSRATELEKLDPTLAKSLKGVFTSLKDCNFDMHEGNFMRRGDVIIISDPVF